MKKKKNQSKQEVVFFSSKKGGVFLQNIWKINDSYIIRNINISTENEGWKIKRYQNISKKYSKMRRHKYSYNNSFPLKLIPELVILL